MSTGGFPNPVAAGGGTLIIDNIHSPNYAAGSSGWSINQDGTAEFNEVDVRGTVDVGNADGHVIITVTMDPIEGVNRGAIIFREEGDPEFKSDGFLVYGQNSDNQGYLAIEAPAYSGDPTIDPGGPAGIFRINPDGTGRFEIGQVIGGPQTAISSLAVKPTFNTTGSYVNFTNTQWPWIDYVCPEVASLAISIRSEGGNSNTATSTLRIGTEISCLDDGGIIVDNPSLLRGTSHVVFVAGSGATPVSFDRYHVADLDAHIGHTLRVKPAWRISSGTNTDISLSLGARLTVETPLTRTGSE